MTGRLRASDNGALVWAEEILRSQVIHPPETVASLWAGYGSVVRLRTREETPRSVILKQVRLPVGRSFDLSRARKVRSYAVEVHFYESLANLRCAHPRTASLLGAKREAEHVWLLLEDLDAAGFSKRPSGHSKHELRSGLEWLAEFHAAHWGREPEGLWPEGSYWHLGTRPDELRAIAGHPLFELAPWLDQRLRQAKYRTLVHGDPKPENFCATPGPVVNFAAVDFQYVGGGVGARDIVYFLGSALESSRTTLELPAWLDYYFSCLKSKLTKHGIPKDDVAGVEAEWRQLIPIAWLDFYRFTLGWSPSWAQADLHGAHLLRELLRGSDRSG